MNIRILGGLVSMYQLSGNEKILDLARDFGDRLMPALNKAGSEDDWWVVDLAYWPGALDVTGGTKKYLDGLMDKYGR